MNKNIYYGKCSRCGRKLWTYSEAYKSLTDDCPNCGDYIPMANYSMDFMNAMTAHIYVEVK